MKVSERAEEASIVWKLFAWSSSRLLIAGY